MRSWLLLPSLCLALASAPASAQVDPPADRREGRRRRASAPGCARDCARRQRQSVRGGPAERQRLSHPPEWQDRAGDQRRRRRHGARAQRTDRHRRRQQGQRLRRGRRRAGTSSGSRRMARRPRSSTSRETALGNRLRRPIGLAIDSQDNLFIAGANSNNVLKRTPDGTLSKVIGPEGAGPDQRAAPAERDRGGRAGQCLRRRCEDAQRLQDRHVRQGDADRRCQGRRRRQAAHVPERDRPSICRATSTSRATTAATCSGSRRPVRSPRSWGTRGSRRTSQLGGPSGVAVDAAGNVYVTRGGPYCLYRITPAGVITRILDQAGDNAGHRLDVGALRQGRRPGQSST